MNKTFTFCLLFFFPFLINAQLLNGSFETNNGSPSTANWQNVCFEPTSFNDAAPGWGQKCIKQAYGNSQGCFPSFVYQTMSDMDDGEVWTVSGWARIDSLWTATNVGVFIGRVNDNNAVSTVNGAWTSSSSWTYISKTDTVRLAPNETGAVVLMAGLIPNPSYGFAFFDGISANDQISTAVVENNEMEVSLFPSPAEDVLYLGSSSFNEKIRIRIYDLTGQIEQEHEALEANSGTTLTLDVSTLRSGLHIVQLEQGSKVVTKRFYKK